MALHVTMSYQHCLCDVKNTLSLIEEALKKKLQQISMKRVGTPEEIANVALFLSSELSTYMTGQVLRVDGGM